MYGKSKSKMGASMKKGSSAPVKKVMAMAKKGGKSKGKSSCK